MADIAKIKFNGTNYDIKDETARDNLTTTATLNNLGLITFKNSSNTALYNVQLPLFDEEEVENLDGSIYIKPNSGIPKSDIATGVIPEVKSVTITLSTSWTANNNNNYTQGVTIAELGQNTLNKKIDLCSTRALTNQLTTDGVEQIYINNTNGTFTAISVGAAPSVALAI